MRLANSDVYRRSAPHRKVEDILKSMGLAFESEREFSPYTVDIYLAEWHIGIEIDGPAHSRKRDERRDNFLLENYGLYLLRLSTKEGLNPKVVETAIIEFIDAHYEDSEVRRKTWLIQH